MGLAGFGLATTGLSVDKLGIRELFYWPGARGWHSIAPSLHSGIGFESKLAPSILAPWLGPQVDQIIRSMTDDGLVVGDAVDCEVAGCDTAATFITEGTNRAIK